MANINKYNKTSQKLLREGNFFNGNEVEITKYLLSNNIDTMDCYDTGLNEGALLLAYDDTFASNLLIL